MWGTFDMTRSTSPLIAFLLLLAFAATPADAAQRTRKKPEPPPPPPQFHVDVATRTVALTRVASGLPTGSIIGKFSTGCALIDAIGGPPTMLHPDDAFRGTQPQDFMNVFLGEANAAGYRLAEAEKGNLFEAQNVSKAELEVGAAVIGLTANGCFGQVLIVRMAEAEVAITIDWQVFEPLEKKVIFRANSTGNAKIELNQFSDTIVVEATRAAFKDAARIILSDPNFVAAVKDPRGGPANSANGALFPEATTAPSATSPTPTQITHLPLRTKIFREQAEELRRQVVTVRAPDGTGSGFYISDSLLLTNQHVVSGFKDVRVRFLGGREIPAQVLATDARRDVALLKTEGAGVAGLAIQLDKPAISSPVFVIGSPLGEEQEGSVSAGIVSAFRDDERGPLIQSDAAITNGNSGGPMFDEKGNVIGISDFITLNQGRTTSVNLFIPIGDALAKLGLERAPAPEAAAAPARK